MLKAALTILVVKTTLLLVLDTRPPIIALPSHNLVFDRDQSIFRSPFNLDFQGFESYRKGVAQLILNELYTDEEFYNLIKSKVTIPERLFISYYIERCPKCKSTSPNLRTKKTGSQNYASAY